MQIAAYICFSIAGLCAAPFIIWFIGAVLFCIGQGFYDFCKKPNLDSACEFICSLFLVMMALGFILHYSSNL